jgi:PAT family beta-lactamase induction signal transducer AmpG
MTEPKKIFSHPFFWVPTLYFAMGIPFNVIMGGTATRMYKSLGYSDAEITVALGSIGVAWSLKPFWAAFLDMYRTKKFFVLAMELLLGLIFAAISMTLPMSRFFQVSIALFWVAAFASSTQDICADGVYLTSLDKPAQARLAGVQGAFWQLGKVFATGVLISVLDKVKVAYHWPEQKMWHMVMLAATVSMVALFAYHFFKLPTGSHTHRPHSAKQVMDDFLGTATSFFHKRMFWGMIAFVFLYRLGEGLIVMEGQLFLQSSVTTGGLGLTAGQVSDIDAIFGTVTYLVGGLLGGWVASRFGLARVLLVLALCLNVPHFTFVYLSQAAAAGHGLDYTTIATMVSIEKFGYGFGFVGNMIYMMQQLAPGRATMTHYAFATALMNLVLVPTNMVSGPLSELLGFSHYFLVVMVASVPSVWAAWKAPFPLNREREENKEGARANDLDVVTADDPTRLGPVERAVQLIAGRASIYAMLNILVILLLDAKILGSLQGTPEGTGQIQFGLLVASAALKIFLSQLTFKQARRANTEASAHGETVYIGNARGAMIATVICALVSVAILCFGYKQAF